MSTFRRLQQYDVVVVGAGLSGLTAAAALTEAGARVYVVAKGGGYLHFTSGCVDVLGEFPSGHPVRTPALAYRALVEQAKGHPYVLSGFRALEGGLDLFHRVTVARGYPFAGDLDRAITLLTAIGSTRTTCLAPVTMAAGDIGRTEPMLIAGFRDFRDFYPPYLAATARARLPFAVHGLYLDLPPLRGRRHLLSLDLARAFDDRSFREEVARQVRSNLRGAGRVGFPAVLGLDRPREAVEHLGDLIGVPVFEIPTLPPSVAGIRVHHAFRRWLLRYGARVEIGFWARGRSEGGRATEIVVESAGRETAYAADAFVLATGGVGGGGIVAWPDGSLGETVFGLPVEGAKERTAWFLPEFLGRESQPISLTGISANERLQPQGADGARLHNVFVTGSNLPYWDPTREKSGEGVALATGWKAAQEALQVMEAPSRAWPDVGPDRSSPADVQPAAGRAAPGRQGGERNRGGELPLAPLRESGPAGEGP